MIRQFTIYHNSRCRKSLRILELIRLGNTEPVKISYLEHSFSITEIKNIFGKLQMGSR